MNAIIEFTNKFFKDLLPNKDSEAGAYSFNGGVHPPGHKEPSTQLPIASLPLPKKLVLPLRQHIGNLPKLRVAVGDIVLKGQLLAEAEGNVSAALHAPTSGRIEAVSEEVIPHPSGLKDHCITLIPDGKEQWIEKVATDWRNTDKNKLVQLLRSSGIVGLGGATFPSHIKLRTNGSSNIETLIINAAECEPYITCDDMLMRERAEEIAKGIEVVKHILGVETCVIGIEDNKPVAENAMQQFAQQYQFSIKRVPTLYPSGDGRRLIQLVTGKEIPHNKRSTDVGVQVFNVATILAIHRYFNHGEPAVSRIITMTGAVKQPQNYEILFGTPLSNLVEEAGGAHHDTTHFVMGGPMMGFNLPLADVPLSKAANCIIAVTPTLFETPPPAMPCIRCTRCADACPVSLQPQELYWFSKSDQFEKARDYNLFDCIECGCCSYVCPSNIPLVQYYRYAKSEVIAADRAKEEADIARERNEFRLARIEREKEERAKKHAERIAAAKAKKEAAAQKPKATVDSGAQTNEDAAKALKQEAIAAAVARAKAKKEADAQAGIKPKNTENVSDKVAQEIKDIDAGREKLQQTANTTDTDKQAKIKAAIAKAKAKKEAAAQEKTSTDPSPDSALEDKQAKIQAAIAKAKANKRAADATKGISTTETAATANTVTAPSEKAEDDKQAKIQAALAKARANKRAADIAKGITPAAEAVPEVPANTEATGTSTNNVPAAPTDDKQAKIQAALAKARANKRAADAAKNGEPLATTESVPQTAPPVATEPPVESEPDKPVDEKQAKIQAALARARANKKAADAAKHDNNTEAQPLETQVTTTAQEAKPLTAAEEKQAKIDAALARARANKQKADAAKAKQSDQE